MAQRLAAYFTRCVDDVVLDAAAEATLDEKRVTVRAVCSALEHCTFHGLAAASAEGGFWPLLERLAAKERAMFEPCVLLTEMLSLRTGRGFCRAWLRQSLLRSNLAYMLRQATQAKHADIMEYVYAPGALVRDAEALATVLSALERLDPLPLQLKIDFRQLDDALEPVGSPRLRPVRVLHPADEQLLEFDLEIDRSGSRQRRRSKKAGKKRGGRRWSSAIGAPASAERTAAALAEVAAEIPVAARAPAAGPPVVALPAVASPATMVSSAIAAPTAPPATPPAAAHERDPEHGIARTLAAQIAAHQPARGALVRPSTPGAPPFTRVVNAALAPPFAVQRQRARALIRSHRAATPRPRQRLLSTTPTPPPAYAIDMRRTAAVVVSAEVTAQYTVFIVRVLARRLARRGVTSAESAARYAWYIGKSYDSFAALHRHLAARFGRDAVPRLPGRKLFEKRRSKAVATARSAQLTLYLQHLMASPLAALEAVQHFVCTDCIDVAEKLVGVTVGAKCAPNALAALKRKGSATTRRSAGGALLQLARPLRSHSGSEPSSLSSSGDGSESGDGAAPPGGYHRREWSRSLAVVDQSALAQLAEKLNAAAAAADLTAPIATQSPAQKRAAADQATLFAALSEQLEAGLLTPEEYAAQVKHYTRLWERLEASRSPKAAAPPPLRRASTSPAAPRPQTQIVAHRLLRWRPKQPVLISVTERGIDAVDPARSVVMNSWRLSDVLSFEADSRDALAFALTTRPFAGHGGGSGGKASAAAKKEQRHRFEVAVEADMARLLAALNYHRRRAKLGAPWTL